MQTVPEGVGVEWTYPIRGKDEPCHSFTLEINLGNTLTRGLVFKTQPTVWRFSTHIKWEFQLANLWENVFRYSLWYL